MTEFVNSYQFVDSAAPGEPEQQWRKDVSKVDPKTFGFEDDTKADGHAFYEGLSGRVFCELTLECPTVVGGSQIQQQQNGCRVVLPFLFQNKPAIPATSIKGLISSIAEAASASRYRVLQDSNLTVAYYDAGRNWIRNPSAGATFRTARSFFENDNKVPLGPEGGFVSVADTLFGFVRENANGEGLEALAGKLKFSHGLLAGDTGDAFVEGDYPVNRPICGRTRSFVRLKEQGSPMPAPKRAQQHGAEPADYASLRSAVPNFYFKKKDTTLEHEFIAKKDFATAPDDFRPMGRKFYAHHVDPNAAQPWRTHMPLQHRGQERKAVALPLKKGTKFVFHVDYDNLSEAELQLLCFALRPSEAFRHKIGLGRALGLGSVKITPFKLEDVDRKSRYETGDPFAPSTRSKVASRASLQATGIAPDIEKHAKDYHSKVDPKALNALLTIGERHNFTGANRNLTPVVFVPLRQAAIDALQTELAEQRTFGWFAENDQHIKQKLRPIRTPGAMPELSAERAAGVLARGGGGRGHQPAPVRAVQQQQMQNTGKLQGEGADWVLLPEADKDAYYSLSVARMRELGLSDPVNDMAVTFVIDPRAKGMMRIIRLQKV